MIKLNFTLLTIILFSSSSHCQLSPQKVGIGLQNPEENLHIKGSLRLDHHSKSDGSILQVFDGGSMKWSPIIPTAVKGIVNGNGYNDISNETYLNTHITLSPGQWLVKLSFLIPTNYNVGPGDPQSSLTYNDVVIKVMTHFSDSNSNSTKTLDYMPNSAKNITGSLITPSLYGIIEGYAILNNQSKSDKTYYLWGKSIRNSVTSNASDFKLYNIAGNEWAENRIYAYPISVN